MRTWTRVYSRCARAACRRVASRMWRLVPAWRGGGPEGDRAHGIACDQHRDVSQGSPSSTRTVGRREVRNCRTVLLLSARGDSRYHPAMTALEGLDGLVARRTTTAQQVADGLSERILAGVFRPGERLRE